jgi:hypothetical protein
MSCCGKKRTDWMQEMLLSGNQGTAVETQPAPASSREKKLFEYTGNDLMIARGVITGKSYYFKYPGARVAVHPDDAHAFMAEPHLTWIPAK